MGVDKSISALAVFNILAVAKNSAKLLKSLYPEPGERSEGDKRCAFPKIFATFYPRLPNLAYSSRAFPWELGAHRVSKGSAGAGLVA